LRRGGADWNFILNERCLYGVKKGGVNKTFQILFDKILFYDVDDTRSCEVLVLNEN
jgi:hypothetical protein